MIKYLKRGNDMEKLIMVASGKEKADIVFKNAKVFNVFIGDFIIGDVAICGNVVLLCLNFSYKQHSLFTKNS